MAARGTWHHSILICEEVSGIMNKGNSAKFLIVLVLMSGALSGCPSGESSRTSQSSPSAGGIQSPKIQPSSSPIPSDLELNFKELKDVYSSYKKSQEGLNRQLNEAIADKQKEADISSYDANENLIKLRQSNQKLRQSLQKYDSKNQPTLEALLQNLDVTIEDLLSKVIDPLKDGINCEIANGNCKYGAIEKIQKNLDFFKDSNIPEKNYGFYGTITQKEISSFLASKSETLNNQIQELEEVIKSNPSKNQSSKNSPKSSPISQSEQVKDLTKQVKDLNGKIHFFIWLCFISLGVACVVFVLSIYKLFGQSKTNNSKPQSEETHGTSSSQIDPEDFEQLYKQLYQQLYQKITQDFYPRLTNLDHRLKQIEQQADSRFSNIQQQSFSNPSSPSKEVNSTYQDRQPPRSAAQQLPQSQYPSETSQLLASYNQNASALLKSAIEVSETDESINNRLNGITQAVFIEKNNKGNYCITKDRGVDYIVPKKNLKLNQFSYQTLEALFECRGYQPGHSRNNFQLLKPARVTPTSDGKWQLMEPGILQFN